MRPAECKAGVAAAGEFAVPGVTVDLQISLEAFKMGDGPFGFAVGCVDTSDARRIGSAPRADHKAADWEALGLQLAQRIAALGRGRIAGRDRVPSEDGQGQGSIRALALP
jgi:hypothetical protein